ncbi:SAC3 family protein B isoform X2 [Abrus precatorius]|uniref:SAC3 family protein B isoform X2 n=1 Tax=Abrus precatorius TaxID=3816 RepID=A0A8B8LMM0_ABRPR|nr:SAC3 family protein B isoform X2 [Abrus precatorius]
MSYKGFGKGSGPIAPPKSQPAFGLNPPSSYLPTLPVPSPQPRPRITESSTWSGGQKLFYKDLDAHTPERPTSATTYIAPHDSMTGVTARVSRFPNPERTRSPISYADVDALENSDQIVLRNKPSLSPPRLGSASNVPRTVPHSQFLQNPFPSNVPEVTVSKSFSSTAPKRARSPPPSFAANETLEGNSISSEDNSEREMLAKAKRLARFKVDLSKCEQNNGDVADQKASANRHEQSVLEQKYVGVHLMDSSSNITNGHAVTDNEGLDTSNVIIGLCPDMCPESERGERERKGDLDQYERLDGDRNVTSRLLAVKKYTRTAEREASLIRPMPILQKTIDYLLTLLDQPYDERFLGVYNFLWDRMRAIRMDLRMQHIFNQGSITMLEKMIKLHIIAMHELCEYTKGEGFSEGFDAHLNIEQMNKTSVELFQMYDDHRKKGMNVSTEKEFRGYYALLKLDKHPGYKVEPAELSLDIARMTPEIRQTPEVLFARSVARACRTGNFIAFFRLARKSTYLQACLMHAHFAKLRTQALASLHSGLQNNQGLPIAHVADWLAMEDEGIEGLLEYHGFLLKTFEEPYMVKEGPFVNADVDYPTKCSKLVHKKRSERIIEDVSPTIEAESLHVETMKEIQMRNAINAYKQEPQIVSAVENDNSVQKVDEEIPDSETFFSPKDSKSGKAFEEMHTVQDNGKDHDMSPSRPSLPTFPFPNVIPEPQFTRIDNFKSTDSSLISSSSPKRNLQSNVDGRPLEIGPNAAPLESSFGNSFSVPPPVVQCVAKDESLLIHHEREDEINEVGENIQDEEIAEAKLKLFFRLWKRRVSKLRMLREERQLASNAALDSMPMGPPIRHYIDQPGNVNKFDIDIVMRERCEKQEESWSRLNISDVVAGTLGRRNPVAKCLCWKIILCSQMNSGYEMGASGLWLTSKIMPSNDDDVVISSPGMVIWRKWIYSQPGIDPTCCLSVVRDTAFGSLDEVVSGAGAILFLVSASISWQLQRANLHHLLISIPSAACLPLLILCGSYDERFSSVIINELGLQDIDKSRVSSFLLVFLSENRQMEHLGGFFSDTRLREGLQWLADESLSQPNLGCVKIRDLVHTHLNSFSGVQDLVSNSKLGPNDYITLFNEALGCSVKEIIAAANSNPAGWPCPEIGLLDKSCDEDRVAKQYLPTLGWSSNVKTEPIICALQNCKLPTFPDDLSWLARGSTVGHEIENQRIQLENCLMQYLTHTSKMMGISLATKEARVTMQTCARLELCGSSYRVVPHWGMIFHRIFNWRLMSLSTREISMAYVSECHHVASPNVGYETWLSSCYYPDASLDEIIRVSCNSPLPVNGRPRPEALQRFAQRDSNDVFHETANPRDSESNLPLDKFPNISTASTYGLYNSNRGALTNGIPIKEADKLSKLLEQCNLLQDGIDKKLFVYF